MSRTGQQHRTLTLALAAALLVGLTACEGAALGATSLDAPATSGSAAPGGSRERTTPPASATSSATAVPASEKQATRALGPALAALAGLAVKGRAPKTGYDRDLFGQAWSDVDRNGCDTRNDVLAPGPHRRSSSRPARMAAWCCTGTLRDPYTGRTIPFVRGQRTSAAVQIDHVVALSDAWQKGAQCVERRQARAVRQRPAQPAGGRRAHQRAQRETVTRRRGCRPNEGLPLRATSRARWP